MWCPHAIENPKVCNWVAIIFITSVKRKNNTSNNYEIIQCYATGESYAVVKGKRLIVPSHSEW